MEHWRQVRVKFSFQFDNWLGRGLMEWLWLLLVPRLWFWDGYLAQVFLARSDVRQTLVLSLKFEGWFKVYSFGFLFDLLRLYHFLIWSILGKIYIWEFFQGLLLVVLLQLLHQLINLHAVFKVQRDLRISLIIFASCEVLAWRGTLIVCVFLKVRLFIGQQYLLHLIIYAVLNDQIVIEDVVRGFMPVRWKKRHYYWTSMIERLLRLRISHVLIIRQIAPVLVTALIPLQRTQTV